MPGIYSNRRRRAMLLPVLALALLGLTIRLALPDRFWNWIEPSASAAAALMPKVNGRILFSSNRTGTGSELYVMNADGSQQTNITNSPGSDFAPAWSPDGTKIAFLSLRNGYGQKIYVMKADGSAPPTKITSGTGTDVAPNWSPDGKKIVFYRASESGVSGIHVVNANGTGLQILTRNSMDSAPVWSPDGTKIAFASYLCCGNSEIYVMNADGTNRTKLTDDPVADTNPAWSPDGTQIVYASNRGGEYYNEIYMMDADGGDPTRLTYNPGSDDAPTWSPDGTQIVFTRYSPGSSNEVFVMNADGSDQKNLTNNPYYDSNPDWQALPANPAGYVQLSAARYNVIENIGTFQMTAQRSGGSTGAITVDYATTSGTATEGTDYTATQGTLTFANGETTKTISIDVLDDGAVEPDETVNISLSNPTGGSALANPATGVLNLIDSSHQPILSVASASARERDTGTISSAMVKVRLSAATGRVVTVDYRTVEMTATSGTDFQSVGGTLTFNPGETEQNVNVSIFGDTLNEADEMFRLALAVPANAGLSVSSDPPAVTIINDDPMPSLSVNDVTVTEGNTGTTRAVFTVTLSAASGQTVYVSYSTGLDTASAPEDYRETYGTLTFNPGQKTKTVPVPVVGDLSHEDTETFQFSLYDESNATRADWQGVGTILDTDSIPTISITDATILEGNSGEIVMRAIVKLSAPSSDQVAVGFETVNGTATGSNTDFRGTFGGIMFYPGTKARSIDVSIIGDRLDEADETFFIKLSDPENATIADGQGVFTITDNDPLPTLSINNVSVKETNTGAVNAAFTVKLSMISGRAIKVNYTTANATATADSDYTAKSGTLMIPAGRATATINVPIKGDTGVEANETFFVNLAAPVNASITDAQGVGTIVNND